MEKKDFCKMCSFLYTKKPICMIICISSSGKLQASSNGGLIDPNPSAIGSDLWAAPKQPKGPPGFSSENNWSNNMPNSASWGVANNQRNPGGWSGGSTWLLLRNLTAQVCTYS